MKKERVFLIILVILTFIVLAGLAELTLRLFSPMNPFHASLHMRPLYKMELSPELRGVSKKAVHSTNKWGMRGGTPPADWDRYETIIAVGGSTTQCYYLDDLKTWPCLMGENLKKLYPNVWAANGGLDGHSTKGHIIYMESVIKKVKPKMLVFLTGVNDLGYSLASRGIELNECEKPSINSRIFSSSRLLQVMYIWGKVIFDNAVIVKKMGHGNFIPEPMEKESFVPANLREALPSLPVYRKNLEFIISEGKKAGIKMLFVSQPSLFDDTPYWRKISGVMYWIKGGEVRYSAATTWRMLREFNAELKSVCNEQGVYYYDLASEIPHSEEYFYDPGHFTEKGAELVAAKVSGFIIKNRILDKR